MVQKRITERTLLDLDAVETVNIAHTVISRAVVPAFVNTASGSEKQLDRSASYIRLICGEPCLILNR